MNKFSLCVLTTTISRGIVAHNIREEDLVSYICPAIKCVGRNVRKNLLATGIPS